MKTIKQTFHCPRCGEKVVITWRQTKGGISHNANGSFRLVNHGDRMISCTCSERYTYPNRDGEFIF